MTSVAFSPTCAHSLPATTRRIRAWDTATGQPVGPPLPWPRGLGDKCCVGNWTVPGSPPATKATRPSGCGDTATGTAGRATRCVATRTGCAAWSSARTVPASPPAATTRPSGCGTPATGQARLGLPVAWPRGLGAGCGLQQANGSRLVSGSSDKTIRVWDTATGQPVGPPLRGHEGWVTECGVQARTVPASPPSAATRPSGCGTPRPDSQWCAPLSGHEDWVSDVAFSKRRLSPGVRQQRQDHPGVGCQNLATHARSRRRRQTCPVLR